MQKVLFENETERKFMINNGGRGKHGQHIIRKHKMCLNFFVVNLVKCKKCHAELETIIFPIHKNRVSFRTYHKIQTGINELYTNL